MPRTLKTFVTDSGFFELAVAAPSMKAALSAWGMTHNVFADGLAKQTQDAKIIEATSAEPGVVLRRPLGSKGAFTKDAALPKVKPSNLPRKQTPRADTLEMKRAAVKKAQAALDAAASAHEQALAAIEDEIADAKARAKDETAAWRAEEKRLKAALAAARKP